MTDHAELIERLRRFPLYFWSGSSEPEYQLSELPYQVADALAALVAERDALAAEVARMREALEPFARAARSIDVDPPSDHEPSHGRGSVTAGDLRRARAALAQGGET